MQFTTQYTVTIGDINYGGHMGNERALVVFQDARIRFLASLGFSEMNIGDDRGIIMVESAVRYHREIFVHDQLLVDIVVSELKTKKFTLEYEVIRESDRQKALSGTTVFLTFDYQLKRVASIPVQFQEKVAMYFSGSDESSGKG